MQAKYRMRMSRTPPAVSEYGEECETLPTVRQPYSKAVCSNFIGIIIHSMVYADLVVRQTHKIKSTKNSPPGPEKAVISTLASDYNSLPNIAHSARDQRVMG